MPYSGLDVQEVHLLAPIACMELQNCLKHIQLITSSPELPSLRPENRDNLIIVQSGSESKDGIFLLTGNNVRSARFPYKNP